VIMVKNGTVKIELTPFRPLNSYKFELCGLIGANHKNIVCSNHRRPLKDTLILSDTATVHIAHSCTNNFRMCVQTSLKSLLISKHFSDLHVKAIDPSDPSIFEVFSVHKCILSSRCKYFEVSIDNNADGVIELECAPSVFNQILG